MNDSLRKFLEKEYNENVIALKQLDGLYLICYRSSFFAFDEEWELNHIHLFLAKIEYLGKTRFLRKDKYSITEYIGLILPNTKKDTLELYKILNDLKEEKIVLADTYYYEEMEKKWNEQNRKNAIEKEIKKYQTNLK